MPSSGANPLARSFPATSEDAVSASQRWRRRAAALLLVVGGAGLSFASASWLDTSWGSGAIGAGAVSMGAGCQGSDEVRVAYGVPGWVEGVEDADAMWRATTVVFEGVAPACVGRGFQIAYRTGTSAGWSLLGDGRVGAAGLIEESLGAATDPRAITDWSLLIF